MRSYAPSRTPFCWYSICPERLRRTHQGGRGVRDGLQTIKTNSTPWSSCSWNPPLSRLDGKQRGQSDEREVLAQRRARYPGSSRLLPSDRHSVDYDFQAVLNDFDDLKWCPAATKSKTEQGTVVLIYDRRWVLRYMLHGRVGDALFTYHHEAIVRRNRRKSLALRLAYAASASAGKLSQA